MIKKIKKTKKRNKNKGGLTETEKAYIAGIIDGEGCISLGFGNSVGNNRGAFYGRIAVEMACKSVPEWLYIKIGGTLSNRKRPHRVPIMWQWRISGKNSRILLKEVIPYLVEKKKEADLYLSFGKNITTCGRIEIDNKERIRRLDIIKELKLNRKKYVYQT